MTDFKAAKTSQTHDLYQLLSRFSENLRALRDFVALIEPQIEGSLESAITEEIVGLVPLVLAMKRLATSKEVTKELEKVPEEKLRQIFDGDIQIDIIPKNDHSASESDANAIIKVSGNDFQKWNRAIKRIERTRQHTEHLYKSSLISLATTAEWFMSQLISYHYKRFPDTYNSKDKVLSLEDLTSLGSIEDARQHLISQKVEDIMRGSFSDWIKALKERYKLVASYLEPVVDDLVELFQRRNLIVHNGGIVNSIYLSKVSDRHRIATEAGRELEVTRDYLSNAIDMIDIQLSLICAEIWKKLDPSDDSRASLLIEIAYDHLLAERWTVASSYSLFTHNDNQMKELPRLVAKINHWQCRKWTGENITQEVSDYDFSAKGQLLLLGQRALLDDVDEAMRLARELIKSNNISLNDLREWPLFRNLRKDHRWVDMVDELSTTSESPDGAIARLDETDNLDVS